MRKIPGPRRWTALLWLLALAHPLAAQILGEINGSPDTGNHRGATPFVASPFAPEFVITGNEIDIGGDFYIPSNGDGTFGTNTAIPDLGHVDGTDVADMDNDGDNDFVSCDGTAGVDGTVFLYVNGGDGSFTPSAVATGITSTIFCTNLRIASPCAYYHLGPFKHRIVNNTLPDLWDYKIKLTSDPVCRHLS